MAAMSERVEVPVAKCRDCSAEVIWATYKKKDGTPGNMMFDKDPTEKGVYFLTRKSDGKVSATYVEKGRDFPPGATPRMPHYKTCVARQR